MNNYIQINKTAWEKRTEVHIKSEMYNFEAFMKGESSLPPLDIGLLGDLKGKSVLHLQCHFGIDTISIARLGATWAVGVDISESAIGKARELNKTLGTNASFICTDIYRLPEVLNETFDVVYTSYGVISWLGDLNNWGKIIAQYLKPGGRFIMVEFHPMLWMLDEQFKNLEYAYSRHEPYITTKGTYTDNGSETISETVNWSYGIAEPVNALIKNGLNISGLDELYYSPVNLFGKMIQTGHMQYKIKGLEDIVPLLWVVTAKNNNPEKYAGHNYANP